MWLDNTMSKIFDEAAEHFDVPREKVKEAYMTHIATIRNFMLTTKLPYIYVKNFGMFYPSVKRVKTKIRRLYNISWNREDDNGMRMKRVAGELQESIARVQKEKKMRKRCKN